MKVWEVIGRTSDNNNVSLEDWQTGSVLGYYDGKESINEKYNEYNVESIRTAYDPLTHESWLILEVSR